MIKKHVRFRKRSLFALFGQRALVTAELFGKNELANHAAAGAYGFLLSAAPALLIAALLVSFSSRSGPALALGLLSETGGLGKALDAEKIAASFLTSPASGFSGLVALANLLWTARVFAVALQRGIRVVFSGGPKSSPLRDNALSLGIVLAAVAYALLFAFSHRSGLALLPVAGLLILAYGAYRVLPTEKPARRAAAEGALVCVAAFLLVSRAFRLLVNTSRYDLLYGTLGELIVLLANVYFFFTFFFLGAQLAFVADAFDSLVFSRFRRAKEGGKPSSLERRLFSSPEGFLKKYSRSFADGEVLFARSEGGREVFFVVSGEVGICLGGRDDEDEKEVARIGAGRFLGEMAYLLSEARTATARSRGESVVLEMPPELFDQVLSSDQGTARNVIGSLSERLKKANENHSRLLPRTAGLGSDDAESEAERGNAGEGESGRSSKNPKAGAVS
jgi:membrane protein